MRFFKDYPSVTANYDAIRKHFSVKLGYIRLFYTNQLEINPIANCNTYMKVKKKMTTGLFLPCQNLNIAYGNFIYAE